MLGKEIMTGTLIKSIKSEHMRRFIMKKTALACTYFAAAFVLEVITLCWVVKGVPTYWPLDLGVMILVTTLVFMLPGFLFQSICIGVFLLFQIVLTVVNNTLYNMSNMVFSFSMLNVIGEAGTVFSADMVNFVLIGVLLLLYGCAVYAVVRINKGMIVTADFTMHGLVLVTLTFFLWTFASLNLVDVTKDRFQRADPSDFLYMYNDDMYLWETQFITGTAYKKFGTFGFYVKNFLNFLSGSKYVKKELELNEQLSELDDYFSQGEWSSSLKPYGGSDGLYCGEYEGMNVVLVVIESGEWYDINSQYTPTLYALASQGYAMTEYYARDKTNHSETISILGSYPSALDNSILPSINNPDGLLENQLAFTSANLLKNDGYTTNYFHANDSSFYGRDRTHQDLYGFENTYFLDTMDRLDGYYSKSGFYDFDKDSEMISQYLNEFTYTAEDDDAFFTMMLSLISHGGYTDLVSKGDYTANLDAAKKQELSEKYQTKGLEKYYEKITSYPEEGAYISDKFAITLDERDENGEQTDLYLEYKRQQAGVMDLDVGLNRLIHDLQEKGELENTVFIAYADHCAYYHNIQYPLKGVESEKYYWDTRLHNIPFFIWSGKMDLDVKNIYQGVTYENTSKDFTSAYSGDFYYEIRHRGTSGKQGQIIEKECNSFDILPTILYLLGYEYNTNLYQGSSVFLEGTDAFISRESGIFMKGIYFDSDMIYLAAEMRDGKLISQDGQTILQGTNLSVLQNGEFKNYTMDEELPAVYTDESGTYIIIDTAAGEAYLSDSAREFLNKVNVYYAKQEMLEEMYRCNYFAYRDIKEYVRKVSD